jgi:hypothetical protein
MKVMVAEQAAVVVGRQRAAKMKNSRMLSSTRVYRLPRSFHFLIYY